MISGPFSVISSIIVESSQIGLSGKELSAQIGLSGVRKWLAVFFH